MPQPLTDLERRILDYLVEYLRTNTYQPSIREIGRQFEIKSTKTVSELLQSLANKGWIERDPSRSRGVRLLGLAMHAETVTVPCYDGALPPQSPASESFELDRKLVGASGAFLYVMKDDSLRAEAIRSGDLLLVDPISGESLEEGDLVLVSAAGERLVRRVVRREGELVLEAGGGEFSPTLAVPAASAVLEGRITSVVRRLRTPRLAGGGAQAAPVVTVTSEAS